MKKHIISLIIICNIILFVFSIIILVNNSKPEIIEYTYIENFNRNKGIKTDDWQEYVYDKTFVNMTKEDIINLLGEPLIIMTKQTNNHLFEILDYMPSYGNSPPEQDSTHIEINITDNLVIDYRVDCMTGFFPEYLKDYFE
ncbi:hypothetical protein JYG23_04750 [Sedimentibacter sp. zth1]|uniref:hypothetical protein n=1 Tax=Sedimentibacter sp. zth1 TaxID=2816908 RepID=UPI001A919845|nr:hypothetical protein [Sedimentibacter sp. zth1]QSX06759.1 hypothetical protein JYG23_04750 [Sedimentibacter sp. zth1]